MAELMQTLDRQIAERKTPKPTERRQDDRRMQALPVAEERRQAERRSGTDRRHRGGLNRAL